MTVNELDMRLRKILVQDLGMRKSALKLMLQYLRKEQKDRHLILCMGFVEQLQDDNFLDHLSLVMKHGVISMIPRLNASPWCGD
jgi:cell division FtsZ-interacting protein ZapD